VQIKAMFEPHGKVNLVNIPRDRMTQKPRGFAFVDMGSAQELEAAIAAVDGTTYQDREVRVTKSVAKEDVVSTASTVRKPRGESTPRASADGTKKIYMGNIPFTATKEEIKAVFEAYGDVMEVFIPQNPDTGVGRGFAFVTMKDADSEKAIEGVNGMEFGGRTLVVNEPLPPGKKANRKESRTKLYIGNLSFYTVAETLQDIFGEFGEVLDCYLPEDAASGGSRGFGFVTMARDDALRAIAELDGCEVDGRVIRVNEAQAKTRGGSGQRNKDMGEEETASWDNMDNE
jgi:RNA recognition motif-containing protein